MSIETGIPYLEKLPDPQPPRELVRGDFDRIVGSWGKLYNIVPIAESDGTIIAATSEKNFAKSAEILRFCYGKPIQVVLTSEDEIVKAINQIRTRLMSDRSSALTTEDEEDFSEGHEQKIKIDVTDSDDDDAPIIRFLNAIIFKASSERASDVHIESFEDSVKVRFRIDGVLYDISTEDKTFQAAIISRIKVMAGLNIAEKRLPQDGRIGIKIAGRDVDIRVSTIPTQFGERVVMRLLDKTATVLDLRQVGVEGKTLDAINKLIKKPNGIILVTGPTGSGKTTTLYSCLAKIRSPGINILTVEDPIEYQLDNIGQMQVNPKINFTFASGLRAILRQDPDVVMVGEIRDGETAEIAIQASLTGHLVLSTLHTNDAPGAISRLIDMGIEPFLVSSSLLAIMAQRLVRKLCNNCKVEYTVSEEEIIELGLPIDMYAGKKAFKPGEIECAACQNTRYSGRTGIHELLLMDDDVRGLITQRADSSQIRNVAMKRGFETLRMDGANKIFSGITTVAEVLLVTHER